VTSTPFVTPHLALPRPAALLPSVHWWGHCLTRYFRVAPFLREGCGLRQEVGARSGMGETELLYLVCRVYLVYLVSFVQ
jgi:hypothetical protein